MDDEILHEIHENVVELHEKVIALALICSYLVKHVENFPDRERLRKVLQNSALFSSLDDDVADQVMKWVEAILRPPLIGE